MGGLQIEQVEVGAFAPGSHGLWSGRPWPNAGTA
jgi:hypothetical protein